MKIALIQQTAIENKTKNLKKGLESIDKAAANGAKIIVFAELAFEPFYPQFPAGHNKNQLAETIDGQIITALRESAVKNKVVIIPNFFELKDGKTYDSSPVINIDGNILGVTRMKHIPDYAFFHEKTYYTPGNESIEVFQTAYGKIGIAICYDRHYPEYMRALGIAGAEIVVIPQAGAIGEWTDGLYEAELQIPAFQNGYFTALCNRVGKERNLDFSGESFVCSPNGEIIARASQSKEEILYAVLELSDVYKSHAKNLFYPDRRPEIYSKWFS